MEDKLRDLDISKDDLGNSMWHNPGLKVGQLRGKSRSGGRRGEEGWWLWREIGDRGGRDERKKNSQTKTLLIIHRTCFSLNKKTLLW